MSSSTNTLDALLVTEADLNTVTLCIIGQILESLPEAYRDAVQVQLSSSGRAYSEASIGARLRTAGFKVSDTTVGRHRRGQCVCTSNGVA